MFQTNLRSSLTLIVTMLFVTAHAFCADLEIKHTKVLSAGRSYGVNVIRVPLGAYRVKLGLAKGKVGSTESLAGIARRYGASAAINGCFFNAYTNDSIKPPYHHLITNGQVLHVGNTGTTLAFNAEGNYRMDTVKVRIMGGLDGKWRHPNNWYAYYINHPIENSTTVTLYTEAWAGSKTPGQGQQATVQNGRIKSVGSGPNSIPAGGYAVLFSGAEARLSSRFQVGRDCEWRAAYEAEEPAWWASVREAIGCGPRLVKSGRVAYDPAVEGFRSPKILTNSGQRSAVGMSRDGQTLLLVSCKGATVRQLADIMKSLGAWDAMNLDGGASSGVWANGAYVSAPGREISNALLVIKR
ncbi:MAG: phosphodiester glycosidase family protein [Armatimonadota bacterium]